MSNAQRCYSNDDIAEVYVHISRGLSRVCAEGDTVTVYEWSRDSKCWIVAAYFDNWDDALVFANRGEQ